ncbi:MAG: SDR family oxidoreductase [Candidatus Velthaea sp.]
MTANPRAYLVTAAAGGIGSELVCTLLAAGHGVLAADISLRRLAALQERTAQHPGRLLQLKTDVSSENNAAAAVELATNEFGKLDGLANIAGGIAGIGEGLIDRPLEAITLEDFHQTFRLNVDTAFVMTKAAVPAFRKARYGKVVNVASLAAFGNHWDMGNAAYDAAKAAVIGLTRTLSRSLGRDGVRVNVVAPGMVFTERVAASFGEEFVARQRARTPLDNLTSPGDAAALIAFLLSSESDQITGEVIRVSGGLY